MKLEDIKKKNIYTVPDRYFDQLPTRIQARVQDHKRVPFFAFNWSLTYKVVLPALSLLLLVFYLSSDPSANNGSAESLLAQVSTEDLVAYLETTEITSDEILESIDLSITDLDITLDNPLVEDEELSEESLQLLLDEYSIDEEIL